MVPKNDDAEILRLGANFCDAWAEQRAGIAGASEKFSDQEFLALQKPCSDLAERITSLETSTFAGLGVKALALTWCHGDSLEDVSNDETTADRLLTSIMRDVLARPISSAPETSGGKCDAQIDRLYRIRALAKSFEFVLDWQTPAQSLVERAHIAREIGEQIAEIAAVMTDDLEAMARDALRGL